MAEQPYKEPPITEAVIELRFAVSVDDFAKVTGDFKSLYPLQQTLIDAKVSVSLPSSQQAVPTTRTIETPFNRLSTQDQTQIVIVRPEMFICSQLALYPGWDAFFERFRRDWGVWKQRLGYHKITRIGVRYINRIDIPTTAPTVEHEDYLNVYPHIPEIFPSVNAYNMVTQITLPDIGCMLTLNSSSAPSPLLGHAAFIVDQDVYREGNLPQNDDAIYELLNQIRVKKNEIFEACIKPPARELFKPC